jgi:hypothetical protein
MPTFLHPASATRGRLARLLSVMLLGAHGSTDALATHPTPTPKPTATQTPKPTQTAAQTPRPTPTQTPRPVPTAQQVSPIWGCLHCPLKVTFRPEKDFLALKGQIDLPLSFDPHGSDFAVVLSNVHGDVFEGALAAGDLRPNGRSFTFRDPSAKNGIGIRDGLETVEFKISKVGLWRFNVKAYRDLSAATEVEMTVTILMGGRVFTSTDTWRINRKGYDLDRLTLP